MPRTKRLHKKVPCAIMFGIKIHGVSRPQSLHEGRNATIANFFDKEMEVIGHQTIRANRDDRITALCLKGFRKVWFWVIEKMDRLRSIRKIKQHQESAGIILVIKYDAFINAPIKTVVPFLKLERFSSGHAQSVP